MGGPLALFIMFVTPRREIFQALEFSAKSSRATSGSRERRRRDRKTRASLYY